MEIEANYRVDNESEEKSIDTVKDKGYLRLPICEDDFKEFISSLLGKPQAIEGYFKGKFTIDLKSIENLHYTLQQRMEQQNKSKLIQFIAKIIYDDNTAVTLNSFESFITYRETKSVVSIGIDLTWIYLVQFEGKSLPEKQEINFSAIAEQFLKRKEFFVPSIIYDGASNIIRYSIEHTARSWGEDIESLMVKYVKSIIQEENKIKKFMIKKSGYLGLLSGIISFIIANWGNYLGYNNFSNKAITYVCNYLQTPNIGVSEKIDFIASYIAKGEWTQFTMTSNLFTIIMLFISVVIGIVVGTTLDITEPCFILLTAESEKYKTKIEKRKRKDWTIAILSLCSSVVCGVLSNYIFRFLTK